MALNKVHAIESLRKENTQPLMVKKVKEKRRKYRRLDYSKIAKETRKSRFKAESQRQRERKKKIKSLSDLKNYDIHLFKRVTTEDLVIFVNNLYILKKAKFNNIQALQSVYDGTENPVFKDIVEDILIGAEAGERLNTVMADYPKVFPPMFVNFVKVGEESGTLDTALLYARDYVESSTKLRKQIRSAIIPKVLQFVGIIAVMFAALLIGVPILEDVYRMFDSSQEIPQATMVALNMAKWIVANWYWVVGIIAIIVLIIFAYRSTPKGRFRIDKWLLTMPIVGPLNRSITINKFFQAMLLNLRNGMRIQESLDISKNVTANYYFLSAVEAAKVNSISGGSWIEPFQEKKLFKPMVTEMINVGMQTDLSQMMEKVNEYLKMEIDESINRFVKVLPDVTYVFVGIALIAFVITILVPLIDVYMGGFIEMPT